MTTPIFDPRKICFYLNYRCSFIDFDRWKLQRIGQASTVEIHFWPKMLKKVSSFNHFIIILLNFTTQKMQILSLKKWFLIFFDLYFFTFVGLLLPIARWKSQNLLKVSKLRQNVQKFFFPLAGFDPQFSVWESGVLAARPWEFR